MCRVVLASYDDQKAPSYLLHLFFLYVHFLHLRYLVLYGCAMCINQKITTRVHNMYLLHFLVLYLYLLFLWLCSVQCIPNWMTTKLQRICCICICCICICCIGFMWCQCIHHWMTTQLYHLPPQMSDMTQA